MLLFAFQSVLMSFIAQLLTPEESKDHKGGDAGGFRCEEPLGLSPGPGLDLD